MLIIGGGVVALLSCALWATLIDSVWGGTRINFIEQGLTRNLSRHVDRLSPVSPYQKPVGFWEEVLVPGGGSG